MNGTTNLSEQKAFYDDRWKDYVFVNQAKLERCAEILGAMADLKLGRPDIVELGCGSGWLTAVLGAFGPATGVELSPVAVAQASARYPSASFLQADLADWEFPREKFDLVVSHEVFEHLEDQLQHLKTAHGLLRHGGYLILTTPNKPIYDDLLAHGQTETQPIENWVDKSTLRDMAKTYFQVVRLTTIRPCPRLGIFRLFNYFTVRSLMQRVGMKTLLEKIVCASRGGLHLFLVARKT